MKLILRKCSRTSEPSKNLLVDLTDSDLQMPRELSLQCATFVIFSVQDTLPRCSKSRIFPIDPSNPAGDRTGAPPAALRAPGMAFLAGAVSLAEPRRRQTLSNHKKKSCYVLNILGRHSGSDGGAASLLPAAGAAFRAGTISVAKPRSFHAGRRCRLKSC